MTPGETDRQTDRPENDKNSRTVRLSGGRNGGKLSEMNKRVRNLLIAAGVLALLAGVYLIVKNTAGGGDGEGSDTAATGSHTVALIDPSKLTGVSLRISKDEDGARTVRDMTFRLKDDETGWEYTDDPTVPLDNTGFASMVTALNGSASPFMMSGVSDADLAKYGLDDPYIAATFTYSDGSSWSCRVGQYNSFAGRYYFCDASDPSTVYMADEAVTDALDTGIDSLLLWDTLPRITAAGIKSLEVEKGSGRTVYTYYPNGNGSDYTDSFKWYFSTDGAAEEPLSPALGDELTLAFTSLSFEDVAAYGRSAEKERYGLSSPVKLTFRYTEEEKVSDSNSGAQTSVTVDRDFVIETGATAEDGGLYAAVGDSAMIYILGGSGTFSKLVEASPAVLRPAELVLPSEKLTDGVRFEAGSTVLDVTMTHSDDGKTVYADASGATLNYGAFEDIYGLLTGMKAASNTGYLEPDASVVSTAPVFSAVFRFGSEESKLDVTPYSAAYFRVSFRGRTDQLITKDDADSLSAALLAYTPA